MPPQQRQNHAQQLQDAKDEINKLKTDLSNLSTVNEKYRELQQENDNLRNLLEQAKQAALQNNGKARIADLETQVHELSIQLQSAQNNYREIKGVYDSRIGGVEAIEKRASELQQQVRLLQEDRDTLSNSVRSAQQNAREQVAGAQNQLTQMNELLRQARIEAAQYKNIFMEIRSVVQGNPDVLAAVRQKVGLSN